MDWMQSHILDLTIYWIERAHPEMQTCSVPTEWKPSTAQSAAHDHMHMRVGGKTYLTLSSVAAAMMSLVWGAPMYCILMPCMTL